MRLSDLLDCEVFDHRGDSLGRVRDVRLVMDGPIRGALAQLRLDAVIVGGNAIAGRLGYLRGNVRGPALLVALFGRLERRAATFEANEIDDWDMEHHRLRLKPTAQPEGDPDAT
jgi:hypothetical protein